jgi:hypothetical protein
LDFPELLELSLQLVDSVLDVSPGAKLEQTEEECSRMRMEIHEPAITHGERRDRIVHPAQVGPRKPRLDAEVGEMLQDAPVGRRVHASHPAEADHADAELPSHISSPIWDRLQNLEWIS